MVARPLRLHHLVLLRLGLLPRLLLRLLLRLLPRPHLLRLLLLQ